MPVQSPRCSREEACLLPEDQRTEPTSRSISRGKEKLWASIVCRIILLIAIIDVGAFLSDAPKTRVFEASICVHYYRRNDPSKIGPGGTVPEAECKIDAVQQKLAMVFGWQGTFDAVPGILLAVPFGALADRWGRKWIFAFALMGLQLGLAWVLLICYFQSLPLQWTWLSSTFSLIGGGPTVAVAMGSTMISDVVPPEKTTSIFLYATAAVLVSEMVAPIVASQLMERGDWLPLLLALAIQQLGVAIAVFCPETMHLRDLPRPRAYNRERVRKAPEKEQGFGLKAQLGHFRDAFVFLKSDVTLMLVVFTYLGNGFGRQTIQLLVRYASKRYNWEIKKAALLLSFRAATNLFSVGFISAVNYVLLKHLCVPFQRANVWLARGSIILLTLSFCLMGMAFEPVLLIFGLLIYNLGTGYASAMRSIAIHIVGGQSSPDIGKLMSLVAIIENIGILISGPLVNGMFNWGMGMKSAWLGFPFFGTSVLYGLMTFVSFVINVEDKDIHYAEVASEDEEGSFVDERIEEDR